MCSGTAESPLVWVAMRRRQNLVNGGGEPGAAEVAVTVTDRYQRRGIGRLLVDAVWPAAVRAGLTTLVHPVEPTSRPALGLLGSLGVQLAFRDGLVKGRQRLPRQPVMDAERLGPGIV